MVLITLTIFIHLFIGARLLSNGRCIYGPFALVPPDIEQLFSGRVFGRKAVLDVCFEKRVIWYAPAGLQVVLEERNIAYVGEPCAAVPDPLEQVYA